MWEGDRGASTTRRGQGAGEAATPLAPPSGGRRRIPTGDAAMTRRRWARLLVAALACVLAAACTGTNGQETTATTRASAGPAQRDYWPTAGWRTAAPAEQGMDPAVLDDLDTMVPASYPKVRSLLVVRDGYLVYERYRRASPPTTATTASR